MLVYLGIPRYTSGTRSVCRLGIPACPQVYTYTRRIPLRYTMHIPRLLVKPPRMCVGVCVCVKMCNARRRIYSPRSCLCTSQL